MFPCASEPLSIIIPPSPAAADPEASTINLSATNNSLVFIVVVVPFTNKLPPTVKLLVTVTLSGNPIV